MQQQNTHSKIQFWFDKMRNVECNNFSGLIEAFDPKKMTDIGVRQHLDSVQILFAGYANEQRSPFVIPELRAFLRRLRKAWPHAPFFCDLQNSFIGLEAVAHLDHFRIIEQADSPEFWFWIQTSELRRYVRESHQIIETLGRQARMTTAEILLRKALFDNYITERLGPFGKRVK